MTSPDPKEPTRVTFDVSGAALVRIFFFLLLLVAVYFLRQIIGLIFASLVLALAFDPWVDWLQKRKIPRTLGILVIYLSLFIVFSLSIVLLIPPVIQQASDIAANFPDYYDRTISAINALNLPADLNLKERLAAQIGKLSGLAASAASGVLGFFGGVLLILILTLYFIIAEDNLKGFVRRITPAQHKVYVIDLIERMQRQLGLWLQGQIILSVVIFILTFIGLMIIGVKNALLLAFLAGVL
ncbi:MAG TPA: AI-2E family transporter, partial [bacterium]